MTEQEISHLVRELGAVLLDRGETLALAESCTGGWVGQAITGLPGSSGWFDAGFVTYSNDAKKRLLGVSPADAGRVRRRQRRDGGGNGRRRAGARTDGLEPGGNRHCRTHRRLQRRVR